jgi:hypothetical protein
MESCVRRQPTQSRKIDKSFEERPYLRGSNLQEIHFRGLDIEFGALRRHTVPHLEFACYALEIPPGIAIISLAGIADFFGGFSLLLPTLILRWDVVECSGLEKIIPLHHANHNHILHYPPTEDRFVYPKILVKECCDPLRLISYSPSLHRRLEGHEGNL